MTRVFNLYRVTARLSEARQFVLGILCTRCATSHFTVLAVGTLTREEHIVLRQDNLGIQNGSLIGFRDIVVM